jgi:hypothetical protein
MASLGMSFNAADVEPSTGYSVLPPGKYHVQIVNSEMRDTKSGTGQYLWLELSIIDGEHANKRLFERLNLVNPNEKAVEIANRTLSAICRATGQMSVSDSEQLHNRSMIAVVKVRPAGPDKSGVHREAANEIGGFEAFGGRAPASIAPAASAPAAAPKVATAPWRRAAG